MAIFKAIEENTPPTEPGRPRRAHDPICTGILAGDMVERFHDAGDRRRLREPYSTSIWSTNPSGSAGTGAC